MSEIVIIAEVLAHNVVDPAPLCARKDRARGEPRDDAGTGSARSAVEHLPKLVIHVGGERARVAQFATEDANGVGGDLVHGTPVSFGSKPLWKKSGCPLLGCDR